ncbi:response regulator [Candidatus Saccharibacteria bacterium]|nr:response regulator [Candidatus Saccharibacteria bacterium]
MAKIMLVEDDKSLREIYSIRLVAEGYEVISAGDGEEALAMAVKEKPDLIVSDVMMPKISGFDMLDILRSTPETKDIKVIMMTALSSEDQRQRGENLGANRYLVKSQVGIEDVVNAVKEVLDEANGAGAEAALANAVPSGTEPVAAPSSATPSGTAPVVVPSTAMPGAEAAQPVSAQPTSGGSVSFPPES